MIEYHEDTTGGFLMSWGRNQVTAVARDRYDVGLFLDGKHVETMTHRPYEPYDEFKDSVKLRAVMHLTAAYEQNIANRRIAREAIEAFGDCRKTLDRLNEQVSHCEIRNDKSLRIFRDVVSMLDQAIVTLEEIE